MHSRVILHADLNSFFATAEQQTNPALRGKPVGVTRGSGRTCIIAASVEAKRLGVTTGSRVYDARKLCPQIILVPADFNKYAKMTYKFIDICKSYSPLCEVFSLDECFIDVTESEKFWPRPPRNASIEQLAWVEMGKTLRGSAGGGNVFNIACEIKDRLRAEVGDYMTCSIGIAENKLLAKLASNQIKPDGLFWITDDNKIEVLDRSELMDVCGLGYGLYKHLVNLGITNFPDLRSKSIRFLADNFGPHWSVHLYNIARGIDDSEVGSTENLADAKSVGRTYTTHRNLYKKEEIWQLVRNLCEEVAAKARRMNLAGRYVALYIRGGRRPAQGLAASGWLASKNYQDSWGGHVTLKNYISDGKTIFDYCQLIAGGVAIDSLRFCGVTLAMLANKEGITTPLFKSDRKRVDLVETIDKVNRKFGDYTLFPAQLLGMPIIMPEVNGFFGDRKYRLDFLNQESSI